MVITLASHLPIKGIALCPTGRCSNQTDQQGIVRISRTQAWRKAPLQHYGQLLSQLTLVHGIVCRHYTPGPSSDAITVPVLPTGLREQVLRHNHDIPSAGHQGADKTLHRLRQEAYWVNMASDIYQHCHTCVECQRSKLPAPTRAPMTTIPIGRPWQRLQ